MKRADYITLIMNAESFDALLQAIWDADDHKAKTTFPLPKGVESANDHLKMVKASMIDRVNSKGFGFEVNKEAVKMREAFNANRIAFMKAAGAKFDKGYAA